MCFLGEGVTRIGLRPSRNSETNVSLKSWFDGRVGVGVGGLGVVTFFILTNVQIQ